MGSASAGVLPAASRMLIIFLPFVFLSLSGSNPESGTTSPWSCVESGDVDVLEVWGGVDGSTPLRGLLRYRDVLHRIAWEIM